MNDANPTLVLTDDGSFTCLDPLTGASFRSSSGAITEVRHVFIEPTLATFIRHSTTLTIPPPQPYIILEYGFGLGTSFAEAFYTIQQTNLHLHYIGLDRHILHPQWAQHPIQASRAVTASLMQQFLPSSSQLPPPIPTQPTNRRAQLHLDNLDALLVETEFLDFNDPVQAHAIWFDPFGPSVQPESWSPKLFQHAASRLHPDGVLATYSSAGHVRRALLAAGLRVATRPGPPRKREVTLAAWHDPPLGSFDWIRPPHSL